MKLLTEKNFRTRAAANAHLADAGFTKDSDGSGTWRKGRVSAYVDYASVGDDHSDGPSYPAVYFIVQDS